MPRTEEIVQCLPGYSFIVCYSCPSPETKKRKVYPEVYLHYPQATSSDVNILDCSLCFR